MSVIFLLGAGGVERSQDHAKASAELASAMDPDFLSALTLTVIPETPMARMQEKGRFVMPDKRMLLEELYTFIEHANPTCAVFRTNHASNYLPIAGTLPQDKEPMLDVIAGALEGKVGLRPEWRRGL
jgi:radical SAM superfamily enzyme